MSWRLLAFGLAVGLALAGQSFLGRGPYLTDALLLFGAAGAFALWAMGLAPRPAAIDEPPGGTRTLESGRAPLRRYLPAVAIGAGPAACVLGVLYLWTGNPYGASVFLWLLSLFLLFFGLYRLDGPPRLRVTRRLLLAEGVPLAIIMSIAAFLRFYQLDTAPPGSLSDEGVVAWMVTLLARGLDGPVKGPFDIAWNSPNLPYYPMALAFKMMGTSILASRTVMAVYGLVSVGAFYFLARHLFGAAPALAGTFLLGVSRWHFHFSRIGWEATMQTVVLSILAVLLVLRGRRSGRPTDFAWAGLSTGLCLYLYQSGQLLLPALALLFAYVLLVERRALSSAFRWGVLAFILAAGLTVAPLTATIAKDPARYMHRASEVSLWGHAERNKQDIKALLGQNLQSTLLMFNYRGDSAVRHNIPNEPALDTITAALFVLGAVWGLSRAYTREGFLLLSWLLVSLMASVLSLPDNNPSMPRALGAIPPAYLLVTGFLSQVWVAVQRARPPRWDGPPAWAWRSAGAAAIGLFAVAGYLNYDAYFNRYVHRDDTWREFQNIEWGVSRAIVSLSGSHTVLLSPELASSEVVRFAAVAANVSFRQVGRNDIPSGHDRTDPRG
ncbi:MAG: glycosyltransferase family 39 protein, partial [Chloroflexi bacterium]|nr:glycosyltransferase family 39 protein [Chloroflexota bacterium]